MSAIVKGKNPLVVQGWTWGLNEEHSRQAAKKATDPSQLIRMADEMLEGQIDFNGFSWHSDILSLLISNPNLPLEKATLLRKLTSDPYCLLDLVSRKDATAELLDECADEACQYVVNNIVHHKNVMPETVAKITRNTDLNVVAVALTSSRLPEETLESFSTSKVAEFRVTVAYSSKNPETLAKLAFDPVPIVRQAVAYVSKNPAILRKLAADSNADVRREAAQNQHTDIDVVEKMAWETDCLAAKTAAAGRSTNPELLSRLFGDLEKNYDAGLADALKQNENTPTHFRVAAALKRPDGE